ncbi:MAG: metallophosphoesterase [Sphingobacteriales bacterium]|nr:MAG: metallophosphoesterase [Sphingobacteriales bacterium]
MRYLFLVLISLSLIQLGYAQPKVTNRIVIIGNAYEAVKADNGFLDAVKNSIVFDSGTIVLFMGNNTHAPIDTAALRKEASIIDNTNAKAFFVPGYHDWADGNEKGYRAIRRQQKFIDGLGNKNIKFYPGDGCPGPKKIDLKDGAELLIMDSHWWLHEHSKPNIESDCKFRTREEVLAELEDFVRDNHDKLIMVASYHPFRNKGVHSGTFGIKQHIFPLTDIRGQNSLYIPLPLIGSLYPIARNAITTKQDLINGAYQDMAETGVGSLAGLRRTFQEHANTIFISGQEHNQQLIEEGNLHYIVSGAAVGGGRVRHGRDVSYASSAQGFTVIEVTEDRKAHIQFYEVDGRNVKPAYTAKTIDYGAPPPLAADTTTFGNINTKYTVASVNKDMQDVSDLRHLLAGENYRKEWAADVKMRVFHLNTEKGGMKITGIGGGHESKSLQLEDKDGKKWALRSINKNLDPVTPQGLRGTIAADVAHDLLSGVHPYGALVVPGIQTPLKIVHAKPEVMFVPNDPALGEYRTSFANTVVQLEERKPSLNENETVGTHEAINDMVKHGDHLIDQKTFLKARLTDFLLADFDRHYGQWSWGTIDTAGRAKYYPIPKDRDQALYNNRGLIMDIGRRKGYKFMTNFRYGIKKIRNMGLVGAYMDMYFTNALTEEDWRMTLAEFKNTLTDQTLAASARRLPDEIYELRGKEIEDKLKNRRDALVEQGMDYYKFIARKVNVLGGNKQDIFKVSGNDDGLLVQVYSKEKDGAESLRYSRLFDPKVTKEVRLFGFAGDDYFDVDESAKSGIRLHIVGGKGDDTFDVRGKTRNKLYDLSYEDNEVVSRSRTTKLFSRDPGVNEYRLQEHLHNSFKFPVVAAGFNPDDGLLLGLGFSHQRFGFKKYPYATRQRLSTLVAVSRKAYQLRYSGEFNEVIRRFDLLVKGELVNPTLNNFYGLGNETPRDDNRPQEYYRTRYNYVSGDVMLRKRFLNDSIMSFSIGPTAYHYWYNPDPNRSRILEYPSTVGLDSASVYQSKLYAGGKAIFTVNNLNDELIPVRGINWTTEFTAQKALNENTTAYTRLISTMDLYAELRAPMRLMAGLHLGAGHIFSKDFEYFQALTLGSNNYLRGYRRNRFAGSSMAYASAELKAKLFNINTYLLKGDFGLVGFNDFGRVWMKNETSDKWHHGYGGGIYLIPFNTVMLSAVMAVSEDDQLFNITLGTRINLVYQ